MHLVLISLDACYSADAETLLSLPNLGRLAGEGVFCGQVQTIYPTITYPVHASIISGCYPGRHGIVHNEIFGEKAVGGRLPWYWDESDIQTPTLLTEAARAGREVAAILWPTTGHSKGIRFNFPEVIALPGENQTLKVLRYGSALWLLRNEIKYGRRRVSTEQPHLDRYATLIAESLINRQYAENAREFRRSDVKASERVMRRHMPDVIALHLVAVDAMRHEHGVNSPEAKRALIHLDECVGRVMTALAERRVLNETVVAVVSDHGQMDVQGVVGLNEWFEKKRVPAKAQPLGFGAYIHIERGDYQMVLEHLRQNQEILRLKRIYTKEDMRAMHMPDQCLLAVEPKDHVVFTDRTADEPHRGDHGYGIDREEAKVLLWLSGPMFKRGVRLSKAHVVDIAPTLARAVGLRLDGADGRVLSGAFLDEVI